jgi:hypothetical protein
MKLKIAGGCDMAMRFTITINFRNAGIYGLTHTTKARNLKLKILVVITQASR